MNRRENTVIALVMKLIIEDERGLYICKILVKNISRHWDLRNKQKRSILPYINLMKNLEFWKDTDNPLKPYNIVKTKKNLRY